MRDFVSCRIVPITPCQLARWLPRLGTLLYLHAAPARGLTEEPPSRVLVTQWAMAPLLATCWLVAASAITDEGPREWCECVDRAGRVRACLYLLPDTDYLAWDELTAAENLAHFVPPPAPGALPFRADGACVVSFRLRQLAGSLLLEQCANTPLSSCGTQMAEHITRVNAVALR